MRTITGASARRLTVAALAAATLAAPAVATATATAAGLAPLATTVGTVKSSVSLTGPTSGTYGTTVKLTGTAWRNGTTTKIGGAKVWLQRATHGKTNWGSVTSATTAADGTFGFSVVQAAAYDYRAFYAGNTTYTPAWSPTRYPAVLQKVVFDSIKTTNWNLGTLQATGRVYPTPPSNTQIWLQRYDATNKVWKSYISGRTTGTNAVTIKGNVGGQVASFRLYAPQRSSYAAGASGSTTFTHYKWRGAFRSAPTVGGTPGSEYYVYNATQSPSRTQAEVHTLKGGQVWLDVSTSGCVKVQWYAENFTNQAGLTPTKETVRASNVATGATLRGPRTLAPGGTVQYPFDISNVAKA
ncbi:MAG TPA: hypothetical protein VGD71_07385, partial [Kribbella sp.]